MSVPNGQSAGNEPADVEEMCRTIQARIRSMEQRELSQMRQGGILQRKVEALEKELLEVQRQREAQEEEASRRLEVEKKAQSSVSEGRFREEANALEAELEQFMNAAKAREEELDRNAREAQAKRRQVESDIAYWRHSGQVMLRENEKAERTAAAAVEAQEAEDEAAVVSAECEQITAEMTALHLSCESLFEQLSDMQRLATSAKMEETTLLGKISELEATVARAETGVKQAQERAAAARQQEEVLMAEVVAIQARGDQETRIASQSAPGTNPEELNYLRRKLAEHQAQVDKLQLETQRLQDALKRHANLPHKEPAGASKDAAVGSDADPFSEMVSWFSMLLFKSVLVRRFFCVHLVVLYSWMLFLLWWMSS